MKKDRSDSLQDDVGSLMRLLDVVKSLIDKTLLYGMSY